MRGTRGRGGVQRMAAASVARARRILQLQQQEQLGGGTGGRGRTRYGKNLIFNSHNDPVQTKVRVDEIAVCLSNSII